MVAQKARRKGKSLFEDQAKAPGDLTALVEQFKANPALYIGATLFIVACLVAGVLYRAHREAVKRDLYTTYAKALNNEDPKERLAELEPLLEKGDSDEVMAEIVYVTAETAYWAQDYEKAKSLYERVCAESPESPYVPNAVEGLAYLAEDAGDLESALASYRQITEKWPTSFTARRQPLNVGRVEEKRGNLEAAIQSYREQTTVFPESNVAREAQAALNRLNASNPELFAPANVAEEEISDIELPLAPMEQPTLESAPPPELSLESDKPEGPTPTESDTLELLEVPEGPPEGTSEAP